MILSRDGWLKRVREIKDISATRLREGDAVLARRCAARRRRAVAFFSNRGSCYVMRVNDMPAIDGLRRAGAEALQVRRRRAHRGAAMTARCRGAPAGAVRARRSRKRGFGMRFALDAAPRAVDARRPPLRARSADGDEIVGVAWPCQRRAIVCVVTARGARALCRVDEIPELANPGRGVTVIKTDDDDLVVGFGVGRARTRTCSSSRPRGGKKIPIGRSEATGGDGARRQGPRARAQGEGRARDPARADRHAPAAELPRASHERTRWPPPTYTARRHPGPRGPRAGAQAARHVHRRHRHQRLPPPALGDRRQLGRRGHQRLRARSIEVTLHKDRQVGHRRRQRPRHPRRHQDEVQEVGARADAHHAARGRQVRRGAATRSRAACTASARRWSTRCRGAGRDDQARRRASASRRFERGKPTSKLKKLGAARGTGTTITSGPTPRSSASSSFDPRPIRVRLEAKATCTRASRSSSRDEAAGTDARCSSTRAASPTSCRSSSPSAARRPTRAAGVLLRARTDDEAALAHRGRAAVDRVARRDDPLLRQRASRRTRAARTSRASARRSSRRCATSSRRTNSTPKGVTLTAEDIREGVVGVLSRLRARAAVPGADQGAAQQPRGAGAGRQRGAPGARAASCCENTTAGAADRRAHRHWPRRRARRRARPRRRCRARRRSSHRLNLPGKLADCSSTDPGRERAVHRRGRLAPAARPSRAASARRRRSCRCAARCSTPSRRRCRRCSSNKELQDIVSALGCGVGERLQDRAPALPQDHPADGRRLRRPPHRDAAADVLLPPPAAADRRRATSTWRSRRSTASTTARRRYWALDEADRERIVAHAAQEREARDHALQGPRRDAARGAQAHDARSGDAPPAARHHRRRRGDRPGHRPS